MAELAQLYSYMAKHHIEIVHRDTGELLQGLIKQINDSTIEATPTLISLLDHVVKELLNQGKKEAAR